MTSLLGFSSERQTQELKRSEINAMDAFLREKKDRCSMLG
jgi:hypothetical protein